MPKPISNKIKNNIRKNKRIANQNRSKPKIIGDGYDLQKLYNARGLYTKEQILDAKYHKYSRFGRILDPYGRLDNTREYLFFIKPDLHLVDSKNYTMNINPELEGFDYLNDLVNRYPNVVRELQSSAPGNGKDIFSHLLSFGVSSSLDLPSVEATTMDTPNNIFGTSYEYLGDAEQSENEPGFSLEFIDSKNMEIFHFFKGYAEYQIARKSGLVTPPSYQYLLKHQLHNVMGLYKFIVADDMETLLYWAYFWGVFPTGYPREAFSSPEFSDGLTFSVNFKSAFMRDMEPLILHEFNYKMSPLTANKKYIPIHDLISGSRMGDPFGEVNGTLPSAAKVVASKGPSGKIKYKLLWY